MVVGEGAAQGEGREGTAWKWSRMRPTMSVVDTPSVRGMVRYLPRPCGRWVGEGAAQGEVGG